MEQTTILHSPTLESVIMVEETIRKAKDEYGKYQLWKQLPRKMMYQTFLYILQYLQDSGKIAVTKQGKVVWIYDPLLARKYLARTDLAWHK